MKHDNVIELEKPETIIKDLLTEILQKGSQRLLAIAVEAEIEGCIDFYKDLKDDLGRQRIIRNGYNPEREIQTGIGQIKVKVPRSRDRQPDGEPIRFTSSILPPYLRRTRSIEELLPWFTPLRHKSGFLSSNSLIAIFTHSSSVLPARCPKLT